MWLLSAVLILTFSAVAFSNASLKYLSYKMEDPFINWLDIENTSDASDYSGLSIALEDSTMRARYNIVGYQEDYIYSQNIFTKNEDLRYLSGRFFQSLNTSLIDAILAEDNVVNGQAVSSARNLNPESIGVILTQETLAGLGYSQAPAYIDFARYSSGADEYGFKLYTDQEYAKVPIPVLGVVKKLPGNVDFVTSAFLLEQIFNDYSYPFLMNNEKYASTLHFFVPSNVDMDAFSQDVIKIAQKQGIDLMEDRYSFYMPQITSYVSGGFISFYGDYDLEPCSIQQVAYDVTDKYAGRNVSRVYEYDFSESYINQISFMSVHFRNLDKISEFESYVKSNYNIDIEMAQVNAKKNFNAISILANILSWAIVAFSILCIILFVVNLLQSYFQKVKRNLGTFKAFGISNAELISVFVVIMIVLAAASIVISLTVVYLAQIVLPMLGFVKEGGFGYLYLWNDMTMGTIAIVVISSVVTVYLVMRKLLSATPGDLIYDR